MNNMVFNTTAAQLRTSIYGYNQNTATIQPLMVNHRGELLVSTLLTVANNRLPVVIDGNRFTSSAITVNGMLSGYVFDRTDTSQIKNATMFIKNDSSTTLMVNLEISPDGWDYYQSPHSGSHCIPPRDKCVVVADTFANYTRLKYEYAGTFGNANFLAYYNGQY